MRTKFFYIIQFFFGCIFLFSYSDVCAKIVLKMNHQFPSATTGSKIDQWFADQIKAATDNEIQIRIFWSNQLGDPKENLGLLRTGAIDMA
ncbi:MAG: hypothetical protein KKE61_03065, partial [Proteobacteria bacterium]|nr:hypothetical protein [Pseudomonadota bacterium]